MGIVFLMPTFGLRYNDRKEDGLSDPAEEVGVSHDYSEESPEAKARWFRGLSLEERMQLLVEYTDLALDLNPSLLEMADAEPPQGRVRVLRAP